MSRAMTQASKGKAEITKTAAGRRSVKLLRPVLEALKAQKSAHISCCRRGIPESPYPWALSRRRADPENDVGAGDEESGHQIPAAISDPSHLRVNDVVRQRVPDVGGQANGAHRLDNDCARLWSVDAVGRSICRKQS